MNPLQLYLPQEHAALQEIATDLRDAEADAQRRIMTLAGKAGIGSVVRRAQLTVIRRELVSVQHTLWGRVGMTIRRHGSRVADAAVDAERQIEQSLFRLVGRSVPEELLSAQRGYARRTVLSYFGRRGHTLPLSGRVFRTKALTQGWVDRLVNRVILQGGSWRELAQRAAPLISPDTPGGVSFAAKRLARTELNNAFHASSVAVNAANPYMVGMRWNLSATHLRTSRVEVCELLAHRHSRGKPAGVYVAGEVPEKPHPQCRCFVVSVPMEEEEFLRTLLQTPPAGVVSSLAS